MSQALMRSVVEGEAIAVDLLVTLYLWSSNFWVQML